MSTRLSCAHFAGAWHHVLMRSWCNSGMSDANPDAVTQIANGVSTSSFAYDNNGNLTSAGTSTFSWDYNNRMTQAVTQGSTSTYSYDYAGNRVSQVVGSTTTVYPNKYYSITSTTNGATTATTAVYVWNGDALIATIDQVTVKASSLSGGRGCNSRR
jgi:YD repeat-containing protein